MTLVVAGAESDCCWMVADSAITGGPIGLRERHFAIKIQPLGTLGILAFAGDLAAGARALVDAVHQQSTAAVMALLEETVHSYPSVEFAYGFLAEEQPSLLRISSAGTEQVQRLYLGSSRLSRTCRGSGIMGK